MERSIARHERSLRSREFFKLKKFLVVACVGSRYVKQIYFAESAIHAEMQFLNCKEHLETLSNTKPIILISIDEVMS